MGWKRLLAYITGSVHQELMLRNECLVTENRILRDQIQGRLRLSNPERIQLAEIGKPLARKELEQVAPDTEWMKQIARNVTMAEEGFLNGCKYLLHDRDGKFCAGFDGVLEAAGLTVLKLPPRSPNLNAHLQRWNRSIKEECLSK